MTRFSGAIASDHQTANEVTEGVHGMRLACTSLFRQLTLSLSLSLVIGGVCIAWILYVRINTELESALQKDAEQIADGLVVALTESIWNLDDQAISDYVARSPHPPGMTHLRVMTEFDDVLLRKTFRSENNALVFRRPVNRDGELIGFIEVGVSRKPQAAVARAIVTATVLVVGLGLVAVLVVMTVGARVIVKKPLAALHAGIRTVAEGDYSHRLPSTRCQEIDDIVVDVNGMAVQIEARTLSLENEIVEREAAQAELRSLKNDLEGQVLLRTRELIRSNERLSKEILEREQAQSEILSISEREQDRIGGDLHDTLGQQLAGISFLCGSLAKSLRERDPEYAEMAERIGNLLSSAVSQTRRIAHGLSPITLQDRAFGAALRRLAEDTSELFGITCHVDLNDEDEVDEPVATHLYRIAQEAIHNARRHGKAREIGIHLWVEDHRGRMVVDDDGEGIGKSPSPTGMGLRLMRYRAAAVGGSVVIAPREEGGTAVIVQFPMKGRAVAAQPESAG